LQLQGLTTDFDAVAEQLTSRWATRRFGLSFDFLTALMLGSIFGGLVLLVALAVLDTFLTPRVDLLRWTSDGAAIDPPPLEPGRVHTFISHNWASGQDQARAIKAQLTHVLPRLRVWLDVDDMRTKAGTQATDKKHFEALLDRVNVMTALLSGHVDQTGHEVSDYFKSPPCQAELGRARQNGIRVVFVHETDPAHGGISLEAHRREAEKHGLGHMLREHPIVEWHRVQAYQDVSLRLIASEVLHQQAEERLEHPERPMYLGREVRARGASPHAARPCLVCCAPISMPPAR
jgi:hypothetical protein